MSTNITTAFDAIKSRMQSLYPESSGYSQLTNPYDIEENSLIMHEKAWGIALGPGLNTRRELSCRLSVQRTIIITFTRRRFANEFDTGAKETAEKAILEDQFLLIKDLEKEPTINNATSGITRFTYDSDAGIESVIADNDAFIKLVSTFELEYFENLEP